jgi:REP-associated tyrosine transposase
VTLRRRNSLRLQGYNYSLGGAYFVTICTHRRENLFQEDALRGLAEEEWLALAERFAGIDLDESIVMPNHIHGIVCMSDRNEPDTTAAAARRPALGDVIGAFKSRVAVRWLMWLRENEPDRSGRIWQRGYYDRIIRDERQLNATRQYIRDNPRRWTADQDNLDVLIERMHANP